MSNLKESGLIESRSRESFILDKTHDIVVQNGIIRMNNSSNPKSSKIILAYSMYNVFVYDNIKKCYFLLNVDRDIESKDLEQIVEEGYVFQDFCNIDNIFYIKEDVNGLHKPKIGAIFSKT